MKYLIAYYGDCPLFVEGFKSGCHRSCSGAIHLLRGRAVTVTADELDHIRSIYPKEARLLKVVSQMPDEPIASGNVAQVNPPEAASVPQTPESNVAGPTGTLSTEDGKNKGWMPKKKAKES
jgi:hypothetical protein